MPSLITQQFRQHIADQFLARFANNAYYVAIGNILPWDDDNAPETPTDAIANTSYDYHRDWFAAKKIAVADVLHVIPRNDWTTNTVYTRYDHTNANLYAQTFFVYTSDSNVYKCLNNAGGANSTVEPTGTANAVLTTADGYRWKFMFNVSVDDLLDYATTSHLPVRALSADDGSPQWDVQQFAGLATSNGSLDDVIVTAGGTNYHPSNTTVTITGDGTGATANVTLVANVVTAITITAAGQDYTYATVTINGSGSGAAAYAIIPPRGYHGANAVSELCGNQIMLAALLNDNEAGVFTIDNDFRRNMVIVNPLLANGSIANASLLRQSTDLTIETANLDFTSDELVVGQTSNAAGYVVDWNAANNANVLRLTRTTGTFANGELVIGQTSTAQGTVSDVGIPDCIPYTGDVLYVEQRAPIVRAAEQAEALRVVLKF
jgi:hypothetical protein